MPVLQFVEIYFLNRVFSGRVAKICDPEETYNFLIRPRRRFREKQTENCASTFIRNRIATSDDGHLCETIDLNILSQKTKQSLTFDCWNGALILCGCILHICRPHSGTSGCFVIIFGILRSADRVLIGFQISPARKQLIFLNTMSSFFFYFIQKHILKLKCHSSSF